MFRTSLPQLPVCRQQRTWARTSRARRQTMWRNSVRVADISSLDWGTSRLGEGKGQKRIRKRRKGKTTTTKRGLANPTKQPRQELTGEKLKQTCQGNARYEVQFVVCAVLLRTGRHVGRGRQWGNKDTRKKGHGDCRATAN